MQDKREQFLAEINGEATTEYSSYRRLRALQLALMAAIAAAGALTSFAGLSEHQLAFYSKPQALVTWGLISTICAAINQWANPERRSAEHHQVKIALRSIEGAVKYKDLTITEAETLRTLAFRDPELALQKLSGTPG